MQDVETLHREAMGQNHTRPHMAFVSVVGRSLSQHHRFQLLLLFWG
jgi:hypothetical protein